MTHKAIHWFRQDLRLADNPALCLAAKHDQIFPIYILDDENAGDYAMGGASRWWLHHALTALNRDLGGTLSVYCGDPQTILEDLITRLDIGALYWNRCYEPWRIARDKTIKSAFKQQGITAESTNGSLLWEAATITKDDGHPYKVFTPFYRKGCLSAPAPRMPLPALSDAAISICTKDSAQSLEIDDLNLLPRKPNLPQWDQQLVAHWDISESGAHRQFDEFIAHGLAHYKEGRNIPAKPFVSRLSPYLHFGHLSPNQLWYGVRRIDLESGGEDKHIDHFCSELGWREFSHQLLYHNPELPKRNLQSKFDAFPWIEDQALLKAWQTGQTGIPMVDAGMRELWQTGYMHNRVRMIVGSFLVKNLRLHWHHGERWFWDTLVDADLANNSASWQWIAGCGADAAPYFRIFNPVTQGLKFDPEGEYVRRYIPEIKGLPDKYLFSPWEASAAIQQQAGIIVGKDYPLPIIDLKQSREAALAAFQSIKQ
ncbi:MAG: deoxyribodipyrimidine photo-lyase [Alphaproteobacteria bacterium]